jgi:cytochrome c553
LLLAAGALGTGAQAATTDEAEWLYQRHCAACHGADRLGGSGPALLPENLRRLNKPKAAMAIAKGLPASQMPAFEAQLSDGQVAALVELIYRPLAAVPDWGLAEITASRVIASPPESLPADPVHGADPLNLFVVVESGDHRVTILDGDRLEPITRFPSRYALHGGPKFSPDGRFVYFASRDGWITKYDLYGLKMVAEARAGINTRNLAISHDGRVVAVANYLPHTLVLLDAGDLTPLEVMPVKDLRGKTSSRVSAVYQAAPRESFVVALKDLPEIWEISYAKQPPAIYSGLVHSYEQGMEEALPATGAFPVRRIELKAPLDDFFFTPSYNALIGSARDSDRAVVVNLDVRREIAELPLPGLPHLGSVLPAQPREVALRLGRRVLRAES